MNTENPIFTMNETIKSPQPWLIIRPTPTGFDIVIPEGVEPTQAAKEFILMVREQLARENPPKAKTYSYWREDPVKGWIKVE
jgi:hypothetical protein